jgi:predicted RNA methylase
MLYAPHAVSEALRAGQRVRDAEFDRVYPDDVRRVSARFWTPVDVAATAARWLGSLGASSVLDVGSGCGKFCIVSQLASGCAVSGLEQREHLIEVARAASARYDAAVNYLHGTLETVDPSGFDAYYLFNPFGENLYSPNDQFDDVPELSALRYMHDLAIIEHWLDHAPIDTCFVTYHGFGGRLPNNYVLERAQRKGSDHLRLWQKKHEGRAEAFTLEVDAARTQSGKLAEQRSRKGR